MNFQYLGRRKCVQVQTEAVLNRALHDQSRVSAGGRAWAVRRTTLFATHEVGEGEHQVLRNCRIEFLVRWQAQGSRTGASIRLTVLLVAPDDDSDTDVGLAVLVTAGVDRDDARELEVPLERRGRKGSKEATRSGVDVDLLVEPNSLNQVLHLATREGERGNGPEQTRPSAPRTHRGGRSCLERTRKFRCRSSQE